MLIGRKLYIIAIVINTLLAHIGGHFLQIHWIHIFNSLILVCILNSILEWKYDWVDEAEEEKEG